MPPVSSAAVERAFTMMLHDGYVVKPMCSVHTVPLTLELIDTFERNHGVTVKYLIQLPINTLLKTRTEQ